jgi:hypothetical protein
MDSTNYSKLDKIDIKIMILIKLSALINDNILFL